MLSKDVVRYTFRFIESFNDALAFSASCKMVREIFKNLSPHLLRDYMRCKESVHYYSKVSLACIFPKHLVVFDTIRVWKHDDVCWYIFRKSNKFHVHRTGFRGYDLEQFACTCGESWPQHAFNHFECVKHNPMKWTIKMNNVRKFIWKVIRFRLTTKEAWKINPLLI